MVEANRVEIVSETEYIQQFYDAVIQKQVLIDSYPEGQLPADVKQSIISELDSLCPYKDEVVCMNGAGVVPYFGEDGEWQQDAQIQTHGETQVGIHNGVAIIADPENAKRLVIMHHVVGSSEYEMKGFTYTRLNNYNTFFNLNASLTLVDQLERCWIKGEPEVAPNWEKLLTNRSKELRSSIHSKDFRQLKRKKQISQIDSVVEQLEEETRLIGVNLKVLAEYCYVPYPTINQRDVSWLPLDNLKLQGTCLGLLSLDTYVEDLLPIRKLGDRLDKKGGVCMVFDPEVEQKDLLGISSDQVIFIPTLQKINYELI